MIQVSYGMTGISCALQIADAAFGYELPITLGGSPGLIHAHLATVMPNFMTLEVPDPVVRDGVFTSDIEIVDGWAVLGDRPGLGLEIDREALEKGRVDAIPAGSGPSSVWTSPGGGIIRSVAHGG